MAALQRKHVKIDLKELNNQVVKYGDLKIGLRVEWASNTDERSHLILEFYDEKSPQPFTAPATCPPAMAHYPPHQQQAISYPACPQPHVCPHSSSMPNEPAPYRPVPSMTPNEHSDVTSTTMFESITPLSPEEERIQKIKSSLQSETLSLSGHTTVSDLRYAIPNFLSQALPTSLNEHLLGNSMSDAYPLMEIDAAPDALGSSGEFHLRTMATSNVQSIFCPCSNPTNHHEQGCPAVSLNRHRPTNLAPGATLYKTSASQLSFIRAPSTVHTYPDGAYSITSARNSSHSWFPPLTPTTNLFQPVSLASEMTTAISQQSMFTIRPSTHHPGKPSPQAADHAFHSPASMLSSPTSSNYLPSPPVPKVPVQSPQSMPTAGKPSQYAHTMVQGQSPRRDQLLTPSLNDLHLNNHGETTLSNSPSSVQHTVFFRQNTAGTSVPVTTVRARQSPSNGHGEGEEQRSPTVPPSITNVKSPVELDIGLRERFVRSNSTTTEIDRMFPDVSPSKNTAVVEHSTTLASWQSPDGQALSSMHPMQNQALPTIYSPVLNRQGQKQPCEASRAADAPIVVFPLPMTNQLGTGASAANQLMYAPRKRGRPRRAPDAPPKPAATTGAKRGRKPGTKMPKSSKVSSATSISTSSSEAVPSSTASLPTSFTHSNQNSEPGEITMTVDSGCRSMIRPCAAPADRSAQTIDSLPLLFFGLIDEFPTRSSGDLDSAVSSFSPLSVSTPTDASSEPLASLEQFFASPIADLDDICETSSLRNITTPMQTWQENQASTSAKTVKRNSQTMKTQKRPTSTSTKNDAPVKIRRVGRPPGKASKKNRPAQPTAAKAKCTQCASERLMDITEHEFPNQKGLVFECSSCGNTSLRSNVSPAERRARLNQVATDHLDRVKCQFCQMIFTSHPDYMKHLKNDHGSDKPT